MLENRVLHFKVIPNSKKESFQKISEKEYKVKLKEVPEKGKANKRLIELISDRFNISKDRIKIKNPSSRKKIVFIGS